MLSKKTGLILLLMAALGLILTSLILPKTDNKVISAAYVPAGFYAPIVIANENGYFTDLGYELELKRYNNNSLMINSFINGSLDLTAQSSFTMFPVEEQNPGRFKFVYGQYANSYFFIAPVDSGIKSLRDLKGKTIGAWQSPTAVAYVDLMLAKSGLTKEDYSVERFAVSDVAANLTSGVVDAVFVFDFQAASLQEKSGYVIIEANAQKELLSNVGIKPFNGGAMISTKVLQSDPMKSEAIQLALSKAIEFIDENPIESREIIASLLGVEINDLSSVQLDYFTMPNSTLIKSAESTYLLLSDSGIVKGDRNIRTLFVE